MSETILRILLSELTTVRIRCQFCDTIVELPVESLAKRFDAERCAHCHEYFDMNKENVNPLAALSDAINGFAKFKDKLEVGFILPATRTVTETITPKS